MIKIKILDGLTMEGKTKTNRFRKTTTQQKW